MLKAGSERDFTLEASDGHAAAAELALDRVAVAKGCLHALEQVRHRLHPWPRRHER
jgi:hypothetical protein